MRELSCCDLRARPQLHWPLLGFTWDQVDWNAALRECRRRVDPRSLCGLGRPPHAAGCAYARLIEGWGEVLTRKVRAFRSRLQG